MRVIQAALCSYGMSGKVFHAPLLHFYPGYQVYGVYERSRRQSQQDYPSSKHFTTLETLLADPAVELVIVNTPNATHFDYCKKALLAGKHVVVEKPFVTTVSEAKELEHLAKAQEKVLAVYHNRRFDSDFLTVKKILEAGVLGKTVEAEFHFDRFKQVLSPKSHKELPGGGAGIVYDLGSHIIDQALHLFGMPQAVFADIAIMRYISQVDDYFEILLYYPGKRVRLKGGYQVKHLLPSYILHGSEGSFVKHRADVQEAELQAGKYSGLSADWGKEPDWAKGILDTVNGGDEIVETLQGNYSLFYEKLYQAIEHNEQPPVSAAEGTRVIQVIEAAFESSRQKQVIPISV